MAQTPEQRHKKLDTWFKVGIIGGTIIALGVLAPFLFAALKGMIALGILLGLGSFVIALLMGVFRRSA